MHQHPDLQNNETVNLLARLVHEPSVAPRAEAALNVLEAELGPAGFDIQRPVFSETGTEDVENLFAAIGNGPRHLTFAGHVDVVPEGSHDAWTYPPFAAEIVGDTMYGRGTVDMKGGVAAMVIAAKRFIAKNGVDFDGRLSLLITGDEEAIAVNGTVKLLQWAVERGERFTSAIVGEPTSVTELGDQIKIGRRGSYSATLIVEGVQGHSAYPDLADNPVRGLVTLLGFLMDPPLDSGTESFEPSTLEIVSVDVGNTAFNVIPLRATARLNSRFNDNWTPDTLDAALRTRLTMAAEETRLRQGSLSPIEWSLKIAPPVADVFHTHDENLISIVSSAIIGKTGRTPALSTGGGSSDARFIKDYCPVVEFGVVGRTMHQIDESISLSDLVAAADIYESIMDAYFEK